MQSVSEVEVKALELVEKQLLPLWLSLKERVLHEVEDDELADNLPTECRVLSPSDFGFHNALEHEGRLFFVDFEYAGWDDPAKLICDFICQPELPISENHAQQFIEELVGHLPNPDAIIQRVERLLPVHRLKWCCILLNEFRTEDRQRRLHAGVESNGLLVGQLGKATQYFATHLAKTH